MRQRADLARGELDRGDGMRKSSNALLAVACFDVLIAALGGFVLALSLSNDVP